MDEITSRQFNKEEVNRIIRRALKLEQADTVCHQDFKAIHFSHGKRSENKIKLIPKRVGLS